MASPPVFLPPAANALWKQELDQMPRWRARLVHTGRIAYVIVRDVAEGNLTLRATSLVYTTLMSLVPLLAISFSVLKSFGVHDFIQPFLLNVLAPLGERADEITGRIIGFVDNMRVGVLGAVGLGLLVWTVISLMQKIEATFNETWRISEQRTVARRFSDFLSVILIAPLLIFSALGIGASLGSNAVVEYLRSYEIVGWAIGVARTVAPYLLIVGAFTFIYVFVPNTRVRVFSAFVGAVIAGFMWAGAGKIFSSFVVGSTNYTAIYSAFATAILFMIWLYVSWLILLVGASIAFYHQHPEDVRPLRVPVLLSNEVKERTALQLMRIIGRDYCDGKRGWTLDRLAKAVSLNGETTGPVLEALEIGRLLARTADKPPCYLPARPLERTPLTAVLAAVRNGEAHRRPGMKTLRADPPTDRVIETIDRAVAEALGGRSVMDLVLEDDDKMRDKAEQSGHDNQQATRAAAG